MLEKASNICSAWLNTEIIVNQERPNQKTTSFSTRINRTADWALTPLRYLCNGKKLVITLSKNDQVIKAYLGRSVDKTWQKTALMVSLVVPAALFGLALKAICLASSDIRRNISFASVLLPQQLAIQLANAKLTASYKSLKADLDSFYSYMNVRSDKGKAIWKEGETLQKMNCLLQKASTNMQELLLELARICKCDPEKMAKLLATQWERENDPLFSYCFLNNSLWAIYDIARNLSYQRQDGDFMPAEYLKEDDALFFDGKSMQYGWRRDFNAAISKFDDYSNENTSLRILLEKDLALTTDENPRGERDIFEAHNRYPDPHRPYVLVC